MAAAGSRKLGNGRSKPGIRLTDGSSILPSSTTTTQDHITASHSAKVAGDILTMLIPVSRLQASPQPWMSAALDVNDGTDARLVTKAFYRVHRRDSTGF